MNIVIYDCEIKRGIPARGEEKIPGIEYCRGWGDHAEMGVSVTGVYEYEHDSYRVFCDDNVDEMLELFARADLLVGFNSIRFDDKLLGATFEDFIDITTPRYDLLVEIMRAAGTESFRGFGLDAMCEANFGERKSGHGAMAPVDWQRGNIGSVIDYCLNDVRMTKLLMDAVLSRRALVNPKGGVLRLLRPEPDRVPPEVHEEEPSFLDSATEAATEVDIAELQKEQAAKTLPPANVPTDPHHWNNLLVEFEQLVAEDRVMVAVHTGEGLLIKRRLMLHEWSEETLNDALLNKDGPAVVKYLREHEELYAKIGDESGNVD